mmetsp:Transcript_22247/g.62504  ORF Transcript_22247/g.62504 Transcript_22247/m.62504 type:complete len:99 (+) Transcript_22247:778-1074(+)
MGRAITENFFPTREQHSSHIFPSLVRNVWMTMRFDTLSHLSHRACSLNPFHTRRRFETCFDRTSSWMTDGDLQHMKHHLMAILFYSQTRSVPYSLCLS